MNYHTDPKRPKRIEFVAARLDWGREELITGLLNAGLYSKSGGRIGVSLYLDGLIAAAQKLSQGFRDGDGI